MKQYVRVYLNPKSGEIKHAVTQDAPLDASNLIEGNYDTEDMEIETIGFLRAGKILEKIENKEGRIELKATPGFKKTKAHLRKKVK